LFIQFDLLLEVGLDLELLGDSLVERLLEVSLELDRLPCPLRLVFQVAHELILVKVVDLYVQLAVHV
jgi:hypothetical protein